MFHIGLKWLQSLRFEASRLGWIWVLGYRVLKRVGVREIKFRPVKLSSPVYCRIEGSDIWEYKQSLGTWAEPLNLRFVPETIIDAGANVGYASLRFAREFAEAKIIAVEPASANLIQLRKNCGQNPNISVEPFAVWSHSTLLRVADTGVAHNAYQLLEDPNGDVPALSFLDLMEKHAIERVDLLKIDIEGAEKLLFEDLGATSWLGRVGMLLIETHDRMIPGCSTAVKNALHDRAAFQGWVNEYEYYLFNEYAGD